MANTYMEGDGDAISLTYDDLGLDEGSSDTSDSGSYGVRDYDADVASGPDETTGTVNVDAIEADDDLATEDAAEPVDPNAHVAQAGGELADGETSPEDPTVTVTMSTGTTYDASPDQEVDGDEVSDPRFAVADRWDQLQNQMAAEASGVGGWAWLLLLGLLGTVAAAVAGVDS